MSVSNRGNTGLGAIVTGSERVLQKEEFNNQDSAAIKSEPVEDILIPEDAVLQESKDASENDVALEQNNQRQFVLVQGKDGKKYVMVAVATNPIRPECGCCIEKLEAEGLPRDCSKTIEYINRGKPEPNFDTWPASWKRSGSRASMKLEWVAGCNAKYSLYCWPCLLFAEKSSPWNDKGFQDPMNYTKSVRRHENSVSHIQATLQYWNLIKKQQPINLNSPYLKQKEYKNKKAVFNIYSAVVLTLQAAESYSLDNYDLSRLAGTLDNEDLLKIPTLYESILECLNTALREQINHEIRQAPYYSVTLDIVAVNKLVAVVHFITDEGDMADRFINVYGLDDGPLPVIEELKTLGTDTIKMTSLCLGGVPCIELIPRVPKTETFIFHSPRHRMSQVLPIALFHIKECAAFFHTLQGLSVWIEASQEEINAEFTNISPLRWRERLVETALENKNQLLEVIQSTIDKLTPFEGEKYTLALGLTRAFKDMEFLFLLSIFGEIFPITDALLDLLINQGICNIQHFNNTVSDYVKVLNWKKEKFDEIWELVNDECINDLATPPAKRPRHIKSSKIVNYYKNMYENIINVIVSQIEMRFQDLPYLEIGKLLHFSKPVTAVSDKAIAMIKQTVAVNILSEHGRLKTELQAISKIPEYQDQTFKDLLKMMGSHSKDNIIKQTIKLCKFVGTLPYVTKQSNDTSCKFLDKVKEVTRKKSHIPDILRIHLDLLPNFLGSDEFNSRVQELFQTLHPGVHLGFAAKSTNDN